MQLQRYHQVISGTTATTTGTSATSEIIGDVVHGLSKYDWFTIDASLAGNALGTLDVYVQRQVSSTAQVSGGVWADWIHFPQQSAGGARTYYTIQSNPLQTITVVGRGTDASYGTPALAANTNVGGHPGDAIRVVAVASAATMTGADLAVTVNAWRQQA